MDVFKILSTLAVFLFGTAWAFKNLRAIFDKVSEVTGVQNEPKNVTTTESGIKITTASSNTSSNTGA